MIKSILKWALGIIGAAAIGSGVVHAVKMGTDENYRTHINAAWGIEQTVEDENPEDELPGDETTGDENGDSTTGDETTNGAEDEGTTDVPTQPSTGEDESDIPTA